jgi:hypothetical protein
MLSTAESLGAGMGAGERVVTGEIAEGGEKKKAKKAKKAKPQDEIGNGPLRVWVGERMLGMSASLFSYPLFFALFALSITVVSYLSLPPLC